MYKPTDLCIGGAVVFRRVVFQGFLYLGHLHQFASSRQYFVFAFKGRNIGNNCA